VKPITTSTQWRSLPTQKPTRKDHESPRNHPKPQEDRGRHKKRPCLLNGPERIGSFDKYIWDFVGGKQKVNTFTSYKEMPAETEESRIMSKDLKKRGFTFVGPTICYAYMQAAGLVNDHLTKCYRWREVQK